MNLYQLNKKILKNNYRVNLTYFFLYLSLILGFIFAEDFTIGQTIDYNIHREKIEIFKRDIIDGLLKYEEYPSITHSPVYILYAIILERIFSNEIIVRLVNLHFVLLIPLIFYKTLVLKYNNKLNGFIKFIPVIFFISPHYRAGSIWLDDNILAITFFIFSIYFFTKYKSNNKKLIFIILNSIFLSIAAYIRPIYSIFVIYFFVVFLFDLKFSKRIYYYVICNIILAIPAFYYVFILKITGWFDKNIFISNPITILSISVSIIFYYCIPILITSFKSRISVFSFFLCFFFLLLQYFYFNYNLSYSGGVIYRFILSLTNSKIFFFICSSIFLYFIFNIFFKFNKKYFSDIILFFILCLLEIDGVIFSETFDPLIYIIFFLLVRHPICKDYLCAYSRKKLIVLLSFLTLNFMLFITKAVLIL
jgi:hypothetical protein